MTVYFANSGEMDLSLITLMGVSIKTTKSPIGYFGTGMKFALATLLRTGHRVRLRTGGRWHSFSVVDRAIRGESVSIVCMDGEALPFATTLGRNWEVWQAYRELASNARDEPGCVVTADDLLPDSHDTCWVVEGEGIEAAHRQRSEIFCDSRVLHHVEGVAEVREGASRHVFYRGVRIWTMAESTDWTWNILSQVELTEDRTMKYSFACDIPMARMVAQSEDEEFVSHMLSAPAGSHESRADFAYVHGAPSETFMRATKQLEAAGAVNNRSAVRFWAQHAPTHDVYDDSILTDEDSAIIEEAEQICLAIDPDYSLEPRYVVTLGDEVYGRYISRTQEVLIAHCAIDMGADHLAATLYEEYLHKQHGWEDMSRAMQNFLFQKLVRLARRVL